MATDYKSLLTTFTEEVEQAERARQASTDSHEVKVAKQAKALLVSVQGMENVDIDALTTTLGPLTAYAPTTFNREPGTLVADRIAKVLALDPEDRSDAFNKVSADATDLLTRWTNTAPARRGRSSNGASSTPASQLLSTDGIASVTIAMSYIGDDGKEQTRKVTHASTWSSLSNEINKVAKLAYGFTDDNPAPERWSYGADADPNARVAWRDAVTAMREGSTDPHTFTIGDKVNVTMQATRA